MAKYNGPNGAYGDDFLAFLDAHGLVSIIGEHSIAKATYWSQAFYSLKTGKKIGTGCLFSTPDDSDWFAIASIAFTMGIGAVAGAGASLAVAGVKAGGQYAETGTLSAATIATLGKGAIGIDFPDVGVGVDDFTAFDSVDYSSGEALTSFSDAENVSFGFNNVVANGSMPATDMLIPADPSTATDSWNFNATAESPVSDFGNVSQGNADFTPAQAGYGAVGAVAGQGLPVAAKLLTGTTAPASGQSSGGGTKFDQTTGPFAKIIAPAGAASQGSAPDPNAGTGLLQQLETAVKQTFTGQLVPTKGAPGGIVAQKGAISPYLLIGGALLVGALLLHKV